MEKIPMTDQERNQVLKMIEEGKISPEEGLHLMEALEKNPAEEELTSGEAQAGAGPDSAGQPKTSAGEAASARFEPDPRIEQIKQTVQRFWQIPLWVGVLVTVLSAVGMYLILQGAGANFWFYFLILPLLLGVLLIALAVGTRHARWIYLDIKQSPGEKPGHIYLGFPLPLKLAAWFLRTFGNTIPDLKRTNVDEVITLIETGFKGEEPLIVNVDEGEEGEKVKVYIG